MADSDDSGDQSPARVLVVDDNPQVRDLYREQVERAGPYTVFVAKDAVEALELIDSKELDLVFLDLYLPHVHGREVVERAHNIDPELPIVVVTGHNQTDEDDIPGVAEYLVKPLGSGTLSGVVEQILEAESPTLDS